jgi:hypothetical protein
MDVRLCVAVGRPAHLEEALRVRAFSSLAAPLAKTRHILQEMRGKVKCTVL